MKNRIMNPMLSAAAILLCLVLITSHFTSGLYAKYTAEASGSGSARVASFVIETDLDRVRLGTSEAPTLLLGGEDEVQSAELPFFIANGSEVTVGYSITVDFKDAALPDYMTVTLFDGAHDITPDESEGNRRFVFTDVGTMGAGNSAEQRADLTLRLSITDLSLITEELRIPSAELTVSVYQVD